jgi:hypothetical protein
MSWDPFVGMKAGQALTQDGTWQRGLLSRSERLGSRGKERCRASGRGFVRLSA